MSLKTDFLLDLRNGLAIAETKIVKAQEEGIPKVAVWLENTLTDLINETDDVLDVAVTVVRDVKFAVDGKLKN